MSLPGPAFGKPERVVIRGYDGPAMEPFLTRDGRFLLFNNSNAPDVDTNLHYAETVTDTLFEYRGEIRQVNTSALDAVPSVDLSGRFYFVSDRDYHQTLNTLFRGWFADGVVSDVEPLDGLSRRAPGRVNFDLEVSPDGETLYFVDSRFNAQGFPETADLVIAERRDGEFIRLSDSADMLRNVNTPALEYAPAVTADGLVLFFTRVDAVTASAQPAIFMATRRSTGDPFEKPGRLPTLNGFVEAPALAPDEQSLYYHQRDGAHFSIMRVVREPGT